MDKTTNPGSETDNTELYGSCEFQSAVSNELDFVNHWVNVTVEKEILRGSKLRDEKLKLYPQPLECDIANIDFVKSRCLQQTHRKSCPSKRGRSPPSSPRSNRFSRYNSPSRCAPTVYSSPHSSSRSNKYFMRCPLRIAELAVPTKRQCFDTWRNKCDVLPACMVERLRQQVMDEKPVIQISDAITCFQRRRPKSSKSPKKRSKKVNRETKLNSERDADIRKLCAAFADKIARKLITPRNLDLNPELDKLSKVVANEITKIIQSRKKYKLNENFHGRIRADISDKIAVWIATVLEDSSYNLLKEDLRVKQKSQREIKEDWISTLIGKYISQQGNASELEEEEGPVLDFIEELVDNVMIICEPEVTNNEDKHENTSKAGSDENYKSIESVDSIKNNESDTSTLYENNKYGTGDGKISIANDNEGFASNTQLSVTQDTDRYHDTTKGIELSIQDQIRGEIDMILNSITTDNYIGTVGTDISVSYDNPTSNYVMETEDKIAIDEKVSVKDELENQNDSTREFIRSSSDNLQHLNQVLSIPDLQLVEKVASNIIDEAEDNRSNNLESEGDNLNDARSPIEDSPDDKDKKVKFTKIEMAVRRSTGKLDADSIFKENISSNHELHGLVLGSLNDHLLSDADETWPDDIATPVLKPSASVNRSITSLGKILEKDEKLLMSEDVSLDGLQKEITENNVSGDPGNTQKELRGTVENNNQVTKTKDTLAAISRSLEGYLHSGSKEIKSPIIYENIKDHHVEKDIIKRKVEGKDTALGLDVDRAKAQDDKQKVPIQNPKPHHNQYEENQRLIRQTPPNDLKTVDKEKHFNYEEVQKKTKTSYALPDPKFDYKVQPGNAPSWVRPDNGKGEPSEDSLRHGCKSKAKFKESDIKIWCQDLDRVFENMEMWNKWIDMTCKNILQLKQKRDMNKIFAPNTKWANAREWVNLKNNIDKDAILWAKLNQRVYERLKCYKNKVKYDFYEPKGIVHVKAAGPDNENIFKTMEHIDNACLWIHRTIVSTEYCMTCDCKNNP